MELGNLNCRRNVRAFLRIVYPIQPINLARGFNDEFRAPHSRYTSVSIEEIKNDPRLLLLAKSEDAGAFIVISKDEKHIMITGHLEYDADTLAEEYARDLAKRNRN